MEQYISKSALLEEIERLEKENNKSEYVYDSLDTKYTLKSIRSFLDTLEVKDPWKPTDKQLEALEWSLRDYRNVIFEERHDTLVSLYNDLKKNFNPYDKRRSNKSN